MTLLRPHLADLTTLQREAWRLLALIDVQLTEVPGRGLGEPMGAGAKPGSREPRGAFDPRREEPTGERWSRMFHAAWDDLSRLRSLVLACGACIHRELGTLQAWLKEHGEHAASYQLTADREASLSRITDLWPSLGWNAHDIAQVETVLRGGVSTLSVRQTWRRNGLDPQTGQPLPEGPPSNTRAQVAELVAGGMKYRDVEARTGVSIATISRWYRADTTPKTRSAAA